jgi:adenosylhomocysteine nucleosidase
MSDARGDIPWNGGRSGFTPAFITGLVAEARLLRSLGHRVFVGGGTPAGAARCADAAIAAGASGLISFGLAGGLDPALASGALIVPRRLRWHQQSLPTDADMVAAFGGPTCDTLLATDTIAATAAEKQVLWAETGAAAVDMESGAVGECCARHGLPFAVLRAVCDPAGHSLPPAALAALDNAGRIGFLKIAASVIRHPQQFPALLALARDAARARKTLIGQVRQLAAHDHPAFSC